MKYMTLSDVMDFIRSSGRPPQEVGQAFREFMIAAFEQRIEIEGYNEGKVSARHQRSRVPKDLFESPLLLDWAGSDYDAAYDALATNVGSLRLERGEHGDHFIQGDELLWSGLQVDAVKAQSLLRSGSAPDLATALKEAIAKNGKPITQRQAEKIASTIRALENQKKVRETLAHVQGRQIQGPKGPRKPKV